MTITATALDRIRTTISVKEKGLLGDNSANDATAFNTLITAIGSTPTDLYFPYGTYKLGTNVTVTSNIKLIFANGAKLYRYNSVTITLNCEIDAGLHQIFEDDGTGGWAGSPKIKEVYPEWFGAVGGVIVDDSAPFQDAVDFAEVTSVNRLICSKLYYRIDTVLKLGINTVIVGNGAKNTILYAPNGNNIIEIDLTPIGNDPVISAASIEKIGVRGNNSSTTQKGIYVYNTRHAEVPYPSELRYGVFDNLVVYDCGFGMYFGAKTGVYTIENTMIHTCHDTGLYTLGSDAIHDKLKVTFCKNGIYATGGNSKWSNIKSYFNGMCRHGEDYTTTYGGKFSGVRNTYSNMDFQENYYHGAIFESCHNIIVDINSDSNGYGKTAIEGASYGGNGVVFDGCYSVVGRVSCDDYHTGVETQNYGLEVKANCNRVNIGYEENNQVNPYAGTSATNTAIVTAINQAGIVLTVNNLSSAWTAHNPTLTWATATPTGITKFSRYKVIEKTAVLSVKVYCTDGNGATGVSISLPIAPKTNNSLLTLPAMLAVNASAGTKYIQLRDDGSNNDITFIYTGTATSGQTLEFNFQICYEIA